MRAREFVISKIEALLSANPTMKFGYKVDKYTGTHLISVLPLYTYENDENYMFFESNINKEFSVLFPSESILFVSTDSLNWFEDPELKFEAFTKKTPVAETIIPKSYKVDCGHVACGEPATYCGEYNYLMAA